MTGREPLTDDGRNGHGRGLDGEDEGGDEEDLPLDEAEAVAGAVTAGSDTDESLDERIGTVLEELDDVARVRDGERLVLDVDGRVFAVVDDELLEVALDGLVAKAALATPDTRPSPRGIGWVAFTPAVADRFALDRAEAWIRHAHRQAVRTRS